MSICVVGIGNTAMADDGAGPAALSLLGRQPLPGGVSLRNLENNSLAALDLLKGEHRLILIDALQASRPAGTVYRLPASRLKLDSVYSLSLHDLHLLHLAARFFPLRLQKITVLGVEPAYIGPGTFLSREVRSVLPLLVRLAVREIRLLSRSSATALPLPPPESGCRRKV